MRYGLLTRLGLAAAIAAALVAPAAAHAQFGGLIKKAKVAGPETPAASTNARQQYADMMSKYNRCADPELERLQKSHQAEMQAKAMTPEFQAAYMARAHEMGMAQARGDTAAVRKLQAEMMAPALEYAHADTAAVEKACGKRPAKPAYLVESDSLIEVDQGLERQLDAVQQRAQIAALDARRAELERLM